MFNIDGKLMHVMNWITRLLYLQIIWVVFCLIGLLIGGIFPATFTMFGISRKWIREDTEFPVFTTFKQMYKESFLKANILGWWIVLLGFSLYYYYNLISSFTGMISIILISLLITIVLLFLVTSLFIIPVYVHFDVRFLMVIRHAVTIAISHPLHVLFMLVTVITFYYLMLLVPGVFILIGISSFTLVLMIIANLAFNNIERKLNNNSIT